MTDHPRGRGEHEHVQACGFFEEGSSPRTRGARTRALISAAPDRIIPADAGSTLYTLNRTITRPDHPRGRGEHDIHAMRGLFAEGSSPRTRGAQLHAAFLLLAVALGDDDGVIVGDDLVA